MTFGDLTVSYMRVVSRGDNHVLIKSSKFLSIADEVTISAWVNWNDAPGDGWLCVMAKMPKSILIGNKFNQAVYTDPV